MGNDSFPLERLTEIYLTAPPFSLSLISPDAIRPPLASSHSLGDGDALLLLLLPLLVGRPSGRSSTPDTLPHPSVTTSDHWWSLVIGQTPMRFSGNGLLKSNLASPPGSAHLRLPPGVNTHEMKNGLAGAMKTLDLLYLSKASQF